MIGSLDPYCLVCGKKLVPLFLQKWLFGSAMNQIFTQHSTLQNWTAVYCMCIILQTGLFTPYLFKLAHSAAVKECAVLFTFSVDIHSQWKQLVWYPVIRSRHFVQRCGTHPTVTLCEQTAFLLFKHISLCKTRWKESIRLAQMESFVFMCVCVIPCMCAYTCVCVCMCVLNIKLN